MTSICSGDWRGQFGCLCVKFEATRLYGVTDKRLGHVLFKSQTKMHRIPCHIEDVWVKPSKSRTIPRIILFWQQVIKSSSPTKKVHSHHILVIWRRWPQGNLLRTHRSSGQPCGGPLVRFFRLVVADSGGAVSPPLGGCWSWGFCLSKKSLKSRDLELPSYQVHNLIGL